MSYNYTETLKDLAKKHRLSYEELVYAYELAIRKTLIDNSVEASTDNCVTLKEHEMIHEQKINKCKKIAEGIYKEMCDKRRAVDTLSDYDTEILSKYIDENGVRIADVYRKGVNCNDGKGVDLIDESEPRKKGETIYKNGLYMQENLGEAINACFRNYMENSASNKFKGNNKLKKGLVRAGILGGVALTLLGGKMIIEASSNDTPTVDVVKDGNTEDEEWLKGLDYRERALYYAGILKRDFVDIKAKNPYYYWSEIDKAYRKLHITEMGE